MNIPCVSNDYAKTLLRRIHKCKKMQTPPPEERLAQQNEQMQKQVKSLIPRIKKLLKVTNEAQKIGISCKPFTHKLDHDQLTLFKPYEKYTAIGFDAAIDGPPVFSVSSTGITNIQYEYEIHDGVRRLRMTHIQPDNDTLFKFLEMFDLFERQVYEYIDENIPD